MRSQEHWRSLLDRAYDRYHREFRRDRDPIALVHRYERRADREIAALVAATLAYGNVKSIQASVANVLAPLGDRPADRVRDGIDPAWWANFRHRFTTGGDVAVLLATCEKALRVHESLEGFFVFASQGVADPKARIEAFVEAFHQVPLSLELEAHRARRQRSLRYLVSSPLQGSACKRLNLFLRWVVRPEDGIDLGLWKAVKPADLFLPVDTHLLQVLQKLKWTKRKAATWKLTEEATARLRLLDPDDPVRFDFSLCHLSMAGDDVLSYRQPDARLERRPLHKKSAP